MRKLVMVMVLLATANLATGCLSTRKFTRIEVKTASDSLNARIDTTDGELKETIDGVNRVDGRVTELDSKTSAGLENLNGAVQTVDQKAAEARMAAERANTEVAGLDQRFQNRNQFSVAAEKSVLFKFDSAKFDAQYNAILDEVAA